MNNMKTALDVGLKAYNLATKTNILSHLFVTANNLAYLYRLQKDFQKALIFTEIAGHKHYDIISFENFIRLSELDAQYQATQKQKEIEYKNQVIAIEKSEIKKRNLIIYLLLFAALVIIAGIIYIFKRNKQLRKAHQKIYEQNKELNKLNTTKNKLISIIAHDLRGPVGNVTSVLNLVSENINDPNKFAYLIKMASQQAENTFIMLENLLFWVRNQLQSPEAKVNLQNITPMIVEIKNFLHHIAFEKNIALKINAEKTVLALYDKEMITIVIRNLMTNAIKFTPQGGSIHINAYQTNEMILVEITDTGIGISKEKGNEILTSTNYYSTHGTNNEKGTGLGLIICKELIEKNGGTLQIKENQPNGTIFFFNLPIK